MSIEEMELGVDIPVPGGESMVVIPVECNFSGRVADVSRIAENFRGKKLRAHVANA